MVQISIMMIIQLNSLFVYVITQEGKTSYIVSTIKEGIKSHAHERRQKKRQSLEFRR
jgi:hypothetical protein